MKYIEKGLTSVLKKMKNLIRPTTKVVNTEKDDKKLINL